MVDEKQRRDFFISHAGVDEQWARWIASQLESEGYSVELDVLEWAPGEDFVAAMEIAVQRADRVIAIYSAAYFAHPYAMAEHRAAFAVAVKQGQRKIIPVQVENCAVPDLYKSLLRISLVGFAEDAARQVLLEGVSAGYTPRKPVRYPGKEISKSSVYPPALPPIWHMRPRNPFFTGRRNSLRKISERLRSPVSARPTAVVSLHGMGGIGKTQTAIEYAYAYAAEYQIVWWVDAERRELIVDGLVRLAERLGLAGQNSQESVENLTRELTLRSDWLLVYDNFDPELALDHLRPPSSGHWLLTSRDSRVSRLADIVELSEFDRDESLELLARRTRHLSPNDAARVAATLGDLPLAIEQAGCFLADTELDADDYLDLIAQRPGDAGLSDPTVDNHPGIASVVETSFDRLEIIAPTAARTLLILSLLAPEPLPITPQRETDRRALRPSFGIRLGGVAETASIVRALQRFGLVRRTNHSLQIHRLTQLLILSRQPRYLLLAVLESAVLAVAEARPGDQLDARNWTNYADLHPHVEALIRRHVEYDASPSDSLTEVIFQFVAYLYRAGRYRAGLEMSDTFISAFADKVDADNKMMLRLKSNRGMCLTGLEQYAEACALYKNLLEQYKVLYGPGDSMTLRCMMNVGVTLIGLHEYAEATRVLEDAFGRLRATAGPDDAETLRSAGNLVRALVGDMRYAQASRLGEATYAICSASRPADHPDTLLAKHNWGVALLGVDRDRGMEMLRDVLADRVRVLGEEHPDTLVTASILGGRDPRGV